MKKSKIIYAFALLAIILFSSCANETTNEELKVKSFDLSTFQKAKTKISTLKPLDLEKINILAKDNVDIKQVIVNEVNESFDQPVLQIEAVEYFELNGEEILLKGVEDGVFTELDVEISNELATDMVNDGVDIAIQNMENRLVLSGSDQNEFNRYNQLANQLLLNIEGIRLVNSKNSKLSDSGEEDWRCALAIISFTLSSVAVGAACVPTPVTPLACPLAVTQSAIAYAAMILACKKK